MSTEPVPEIPPKREPSPQRHMARASMWAIGARWGMRFSGLVSTVILARLLTPADYGVVSIAMIIVGAVEIFGQTGQYAAIIRHPNPTREHYDSAWSVSLLLGLGLGLIIFALSPLASLYFHESRAVLVVEILAIRTMLLGTQNIGVVDFRRHLQFEKQFWFSLSPSLVALVATLSAAFVLRNYWALVIGILAQYAATTTLSYMMVSYRPRLGFSKVREIWSFSIWSLFKTLGNYVNNQVDKIAIGGFAGAAAMGRYSVAYDVAVTPGQELIDPMVGALLPVMARYQNDKAKRRDLYLSVLYWSALVCVSTCVGVALVAEDMADLMLGPQWHDVVPLMPWFALAWGLLGMSSSVYSAFDTVGRPFVSARLQWTRVVCLAAAIFPVAYIYRSLEAVVIARFLVTVVITPTLFYALSKALDVPMRDFAVTLWRPFAAGLVMAIVVLAINASIHFTGLPRLLLDAGAGAATFIGCVMLLWFVTGRPAGPERVVWQRLRSWSMPLRRRWAAGRVS